MSYGLKLISVSDARTDGRYYWHTPGGQKHERVNKLRHEKYVIFYMA